VIELCKELKHLDAFVHVSTAYSNPPQLVTEEKIYESHRNPTELLEIARYSNTNTIHPNDLKMILIQLILEKIVTK